MTAAAFRAMALSFLRDRGALAMSVVLPIVFFLLFAAIFTGASGSQLRLKVAVTDEVRSETSERLLEALGRAKAVRPLRLPAANETRDAVRRGQADVGLIVRADGEPLGSMGGFGKPPLVVVVDPAKAVAGEILRGLVQDAYLGALPDVALGGVAQLLDNEFVSLTDSQRAELAQGLSDLKGEAMQSTKNDASLSGAFGGLFEMEAATARPAGADHVAYYAGAVAMLFLFFSMVHGALSLFDERDCGLIDRVVAGPGGLRPVVLGKLAFLTVQGFAQIVVIFIVAWAVHRVDLPGHGGPFVLITAAAALCAAGLALVVVAACRTRRQAQTLANVAILIGSALGGSMVPRFFMPPWLQDLGWLTPTAWAVDSYAAVFWRAEPLRAVLLPVGALALTGAAASALSVWLARRWERV